MNKALVIVSVAAAISIFAQVGFATAVPTVSVKPELTVVQPQDQFEVNITVDLNGTSIYGAQYYLHYNTSVVRAETQNKGPFLGSDDEIIVVVNTIDHTNGIVSYAETRKATGSVNKSGIAATIQFTPIGELGAMTYLNLSNVILINDTGELISDVNNGTCEIEAVEQTPTPTPTSLSGGGNGGNDGGDGGGGNGGSSVTPTPTPPLPPLPSGPDSGNGETYAQVPTPIPTRAQTLTPIPSLSPSPSSTASMPQSEENKRVPGFDSIFAIAGLLVTSYFILKRRKSDKK